MTSITVLPDYLQLRLRSELKPDESLAWVGQPDPRRYMKSGFKIWFFFLPWTAFSIFWIVAASGFQLPTFETGWSFFPLFGLPFLLIGLAGLSSPFWLRRNARSMIYAITNKRAIAIEGAGSITVKSFPGVDITHTERTEHGDGSGDLVLRMEQHRDSRGDSQVRQHGFFSVPDVRRVEKLVETLVQANRT